MNFILKMFSMTVLLSFFAVHAEDLMINFQPSEKLVVKNDRFSGKYYRHFVRDKDKCVELSLNKNVYFFILKILRSRVFIPLHHIGI